MLKLASINPTVLNWVMVGLMAVTFIVVLKFVVNTYPNPLTDNLKEVVNSV